MKNIDLNGQKDKWMGITKLVELITSKNRNKKEHKNGQVCKSECN